MCRHFLPDCLRQFQVCICRIPLHHITFLQGRKLFYRKSITSSAHMHVPERNGREEAFMLYEPPRYDTRAMLVAVDSYDHQVPAGRLFYPAREECGAFSSLTQLLLQMNACMDVENTPQAFHAVRTFFPRTEFLAGEKDEKTLSTGKLLTFTVLVLYRRNSSWQGKVTWMEQGATERFRSVLELIHLINSAALERNMRLLYLSDGKQILGKAE